MADTKIDALTELAQGAIDNADDLVVVDNSDTTMDASGTTKRYTWLSLLTDVTAHVDDATATLTNKTINTASNTITIVEADISDLGSYITASSTDTLTNKTINGDNNTLSNLDIGNEVDWAAIGDVTDATAFESGDKLLIFEAGVGLRKVDFDDLPSGGGSFSVPSSPNAHTVSGADSTVTFEVSPTWNTTGTPQGIRVDLTNTASGAGSAPLAIVSGAGTLFAVGSDDTTLDGDDCNIAAQFLSWFGNQELFFATRTANFCTINVGSRLLANIHGGSDRWVFPPEIQLGVISSASDTTQGDVKIHRDAANILALRNGTTGQETRIYNTYTDGSNNEYFSIQWDTNVLELGNVANGTGTLRGVQLGRASTDTIGFYGATPVAQQATTGTTTGFTAGAGTSANDDSTYTGNSGTAAYTVGDIVLALKNVGILAAS